MASEQQCSAHQFLAHVDVFVIKEEGEKEEEERF
jgi:hypothetical protein